MKKEDISYSDDITKEVSDDVKTYNFGWLGNYGEIDLNKDNFEYYNEIFQTLFKHGRSGKQLAQAPKQKVNDARTQRQKREESQALREWAIANGYSVSTRGRPRKAVIEAYKNRGQYDGNEA